MARIVMLIHEEGGAYGASFPDFPGATTVAGDLDTLYAKASEMLAFHVEGMIEDGDTVPVPRTLHELRDDPAFQEDADGALVGLIEVDLPGKALRVNISVEESILRRIDRAADAAGETRSGFLVAAAKLRLAQLSGVVVPNPAITVHGEIKKTVVIGELSVEQEVKFNVH